MGKDIPKEYNTNEIEQKRVELWDPSIYYFDWDDNKRPQYIIDTPPPYPTGNFHIGNALNWCYIDFIARYKRMRGYNVMFPQGWDCHGLPTEVKVEEINNITKNQIPRAEFRKMCEELTTENIAKMKKTMLRLGFSNDWSNEYITMEPEYFVKTQLSFVDMYKKGFIYHEEHPVNWCPRCETAIALAEVEYDFNKSDLNYIYFELEEDKNVKLEIATSRPELLCACAAVAVNPNDERYKEYIGKHLKVPIFGQKVEIIKDEAVDAEFGSGVVMICTFGDKQDIRWTMQHKLKVTKAIDKMGHMTSAAGKYEGMTIEDSRKAIIADLKKENILFDQKELDQNVGLCWRCKTPIELLSEPQWFVKVDQKRIIDAANKIDWVPPFMKVRLESWTETMEWDWCISRQRIFATPIPIWYCRDCGEILVADEDMLPIDPTKDSPGKKCSCGSENFEGETDVLDTWMDSSLTALYVSGWKSDKKLRVPTQLRPQGHDIIRTWAFYTILRTDAIENQIPWESIVINGMVLGPDGHKMSKSKGNIISPEEVTDEYGADAFRQWAALGGTVGSDVMFRWNDITSASRFIQKLWNIYRFSMINLGNFGKDDADSFDTNLLRETDKWLLSELNKTIYDGTQAMEAFRFDDCFKAIRSFSWDILADNYLELVKSRIYGENEDDANAAKYTLFRALDALCKMLAPFTPFIAEEMYSGLYENGESIHTQMWPTVDESYESEGIKESGEYIKDITSEIRKYKSENKIALNAPLQKIEIYGVNVDATDISGATNSPVSIMKGEPEISYVATAANPNMNVLGPAFRKDAGKIAQILKSTDPKEIEKMKAENKIVVNFNSEEITLESDSVDIIKETVLDGKEIDVLHIRNATVVIYK
ncbi:MAG: valine--tRNA ligase [Methanosarcinaceae archaeon]|nr:valine--tRNA ligase [Methanosarcinaceae archaeon]